MAKTRYVIIAPLPHGSCVVPLMSHTFNLGTPFSGEDMANLVRGICESFNGMADPNISACPSN
jgi:hypothetical protein